MSGKITSIFLRLPTLSELFCVVAAKAFSLSDVMWTAVLVSERLSDYSSSRQALTHSRGGNTRLSHLRQITGTGRPCFAALRQQALPLCGFFLNGHLSAFLAFVSNFGSEADYTVKPQGRVQCFGGYSINDFTRWPACAIERRIVPSLCQITENCTILCFHFWYWC